MAKPDILIIDGHGSCAANSLKIGRRAKRGNRHFSNFAPITDHAPNAQPQAGIGSQACSSAG
jgi:hypothetical protein